MNHYHFSGISSTNDYAKELLQVENEVIVTTDYQWAGRGRNEKTWEGISGLNIYCSAAIKHSEPIPVEQAVLYQAAGALAAKDALVRAIGKDIFIAKYPNDILALCPDGIYRKICGVLIEHGFMGGLCVHSIIGIGINIRQSAFSGQNSNTATSLLLLGYDLSPNDILHTLFEEIEKYIHTDQAELFDLWKSALNIEGRLIRIVNYDDLWKVEKLLSDGRLLVTNTVSKAERIIDDGDSIRYTDINIAKD
jgi:BirA family biotin operon repressor/biotin-[acetyl-CoA-carboxylase] ligase